MWCYEKDSCDKVILVETYLWGDSPLSGFLLSKQNGIVDRKEEIIAAYAAVVKAPPASSSSYTWAAGGKTTHIKDLNTEIQGILPHSSCGIQQFKNLKCYLPREERWCLNVSPSTRMYTCYLWLAVVLSSVLHRPYAVNVEWMTWSVKYS